MKTRLITLLALAWTQLASAQYAGIYGGTVNDTTFDDANAGVFAVFVGTNGQATIAGYDVDSFQNYEGQSGGVAAQFNVPGNGNWNFSSNNTIYGVSGSGSIGANGSFSGTLNFTNGDTVQLNGSQQTPLGNFQNAAGYYNGTFSGTFGGQAMSGPLKGVLSANGQITFSVFINGALNDGGQGQFGSNNKFTTTNITSGSVVSGTLTNVTLKIGGTVANSYGSGTFTMSRSNYVFGVATTNLPPGTTTVPYSQTLSAYGGPTNYSWGIISGGLPAGLSLSRSGVISGTPTTAVTITNFTVQVTNALSVTATQALSLVIYAFSASQTLTVSPAAVSNTYPGQITLLVSGLSAGSTVVVQKFLDLNTNGVINASDWLVQQFNMTDGQAGMVIGGVTNFNVPGDTDGAANGQITAKLNFQGGNFIQNIAGKYLFKVSGNFTPPLTNVFTVTNFPWAQKFTGNVVSNATSTVVSNAVVLLFPPGANGSPLAGAVANNAGSYIIPAPPGTYSLAAIRSNYLVNFATMPVLTLGSGATVTTNLTVTNATASISGKVVDAANSSIGLPGDLVSAQSKASGLMGIGFTDTNGNFTVGVQSGQWGVKADDTSLIVHGYLGLQNGSNVNAGATLITIAVPKATALIYGSVKDNLGNPLTALDVYANDQNYSLYQTDGYTDANGNYVLGVLGLGANDPWWIDANSDNQLTNYVFTPETIDGNISAGTAVLQNFTAILATNYITGNVKASGTNIVGVGVYANATINSVNFSQNADTDANGNYAMNVANGTWNIGINCNGSDYSLDNILGSGTYVWPASQTAVINNNNATNNFIVQLCGGISITTPSPLPDGQVGDYYDTQLQASSCYNYFTWSLNDPADFPSSLNFDSDGEIYGSPGTGGTYNFSVHVDDGNGHSANQNLSLYIAGVSSPLQVTTAALREGIVGGIYYDLQLNASGGQSPYSWSLTPGSLALPGGLSLSNGGIISGTPTNALFVETNYYFSVRVTDNLANTADQLLSLTIYPALTMAPNALPNGTVGTAYSAQILVSGGHIYPGDLIRAWIVLPASGDNSLPPGLNFSSDGTLTSSNEFFVISGTPTTGGIFLFTLEADDDVGNNMQNNFSIMILTSSLQITTAALSNATAGVAYTNQLQASGGTTPYTWTIANGSQPLPSALALSTDGLISGVPATSGTNSFIVRLTDHNSLTVTRTLTLIVNSKPVPVLGLPTWLTNRFQMRLTGASNQNYTVQMSTNLSSTNWISLFITNNTTTNSFLLTDPNATNQQRFYRILIGP